MNDYINSLMPRKAFKDMCLKGAKISLNTNKKQYEYFLQSYIRDFNSDYESVCLHEFNHILVVFKSIAH